MTGRAWDVIEHGAKTNKILVKLFEAVFAADDMKDMATLANAYGYLLNVHSNYKKTFILEKRLEDLERFAGLTKKLMPASIEDKNDKTPELRQENK